MEAEILAREPFSSKKDERRDVSPLKQCEICYSVEEEPYQCKICGTQFCADCGNPQTLVCSRCEEKEEKKPSRKA